MFFANTRLFECWTPSVDPDSTKNPPWKRRNICLRCKNLLDWHLRETFWSPPSCPWICAGPRIDPGCTDWRSKTTCWMGSVRGSWSCCNPKCSLNANGQIFHLQRPDLKEGEDIPSWDLQSRCRILGQRNSTLGVTWFHHYVHDGDDGDDDRLQSTWLWLLSTHVHCLQMAD